MASDTVILRLLGNAENEGHVRFDDFIDQLEALRSALRGLDAIQNASPTMHCHVTNLTHNSPATITVRLVPDKKGVGNPTPVVERLFDIISKLRRGIDIPGVYDDTILKPIAKLADNYNGRIEECVISSNGTTVPLTTHVMHNAKQIIDAEEQEFGTITGDLLHIQLHGRQVFTIYDEQDESGTKCIIPDNLIEEVAARVNQRVSITGVLRRKARTKRPLDITVASIQGFGVPDIERMRNIRGRYPDATGDKTVLEFLGDLRNE